jgi:GDP-mannose 6-dehydrogenase
MKVAIFGLGYVGTVMGALLADKGFPVVGIDPNPQKVAAIGSGISPIVEPGIPELIAKVGASGTGLFRAYEQANAAQDADLIFICVGTPNTVRGDIDLGAVKAVCRQIGHLIGQAPTHVTVVVRSTVFPGSTESVVVPILSKSSKKKVGRDFSVLVNPEFLREGSAVADFFSPSKTVIGVVEGCDAGPLTALWDRFGLSTLTVEVKAAEMTKYVDNTFHALKVVFANEIGGLCSRLGLDGRQVMALLKADRKLNISEAYLSPGLTFGGSCLPKDVKTLAFQGKKRRVSMPIVSHILQSNADHLDRLYERVCQRPFRSVCFLGITFKSLTDDVRESPLLKLAARCIRDGKRVTVYDSKLAEASLTGANLRAIEAWVPDLLVRLVSEKEAASCDVLVVGTRDAAHDAVYRHVRPDHRVVDLADDPRVRHLACEVTGACW